MTPRVTWTMDTAVDTIESTTNTLVSITGVTTDFGTGTVANDSLPTATQGRVEWYTGNVVNGRQLKGRTFIPSPGEIHSDGNPVAAYRTITDAAATALIGSAIAAPVIYSPTHKVFFDILTSATWTKWSVLRSRRD